MSPLIAAGAFVYAAASLLFLFVFVRLGFHQRLLLLLRRWTSINEVLEEAARRHGERVIIELEAPLAWSLDKTRSWSAAATLACVKRLAGGMERLLSERGERVAIFKEPEFDLYLFATAALRAGAIAVPVNGRMEAATASGYLRNLGATVLVTDAAHWEALIDAGVPPCLRHVVVTDAVPLAAPAAASPHVHGLAPLLATCAPLGRARERELRPGLDDPHYVVHTSGTTGIPKGVLLTGRGMLHSLRAVAVFNLISRRDLVYLALPMNHQIVQLYLQAIFLLGVKTIVDTRFDGTRALETLARREATVFFGFPVAYIQLLDAGLETAYLPRMRIWGTTADASHEVFQRAAVRQGGFFRDLGIPVDGSIFVDGLGSSEVGIAALLRIATPWTREYARRVGRRAPMGPRIKVADAHGREVPPGVAGRFLIKGPCMLAGYWNAHDTLYRASQDGWWFTGDIMRRCRNGELVHLDREVDVIHAGTGPIYTLLVEEALHSHPAVMDVCVFGVRSGEHQAPAAVVALRRTHRRYPLERLRRELQSALADEEQLAFIEVMPWSEFPLGVTGKTLKRRLRERFLAQPPQLPASERESLPARAAVADTPAPVCP